MKIYTKKGDTGETSLIGGERVLKDDLRIEAYGTVDELNSVLGVLRDHLEDEKSDHFLETVQNILFVIGSELAAAPGHKMSLPQLTEEHIVYLENQMDEWEKGLPELKNFILPGGDLAASQAHVARCVCRRAERKAVALSVQLSGTAHADELDFLIIRYLNRLSDALFVLARHLTKKRGGTETLWKTRS